MAASSKPIGYLGLSDLMPETGPGNEERKFNHVAIQCDIGFVWSELQRNCMVSVVRPQSTKEILLFISFRLLNNSHFHN